MGREVDVIDEHGIEHDSAKMAKVLLSPDEWRLLLGYVDYRSPRDDLRMEHIMSTIEASYTPEER